MGAEKAGWLVADMYNTFTSLTMQPISKRTVQRMTKLASPLSRILMLRYLKDRGISTVSFGQDTGGGARYAHGFKCCAVAVSFAHLEKDDRVSSFMLDSEVGVRGLSELKAAQIRKCHKILTDAGIDAPTTSPVTGDHAPDQWAVAKLCGREPEGCSSHKIANSVVSGEAFVQATLDEWKGKKGKSILEQWIKSLASSCDAAKTSATTSSGALVRSAFYIENGAWPKDVTLVREIGKRYGFLSANAARLLGGTEPLQRAVDSGDLKCPGSECLQSLLEDSDTRICLAALCFVNAWLLKAFQWIKKDGVVNSIYAEKTAYPAIRSLLENLEEDIGSVPDWIDPDDMLGMNEAVQVGNARGCKVKFKKLMKGTVESLLDEWDHFVDDFPSPSKACTADRKATASSNDFVEGYHGTLSWLGGKFGQQMDPVTLSGLGIFAHNKAILQGLPIRQGDVDKASEILGDESEPATVVHARVHSATKIPQIENQLFNNKTADELRTMYRGYNLPSPPPSTAKDVARAIAHHRYSLTAPQRESQ